ncbi:glycosyltransferase family 2 protein [Salipiger sp. H15]|uniref:Glycosyltransferase family 2 protein n=1 Tax=Alloyangia sp. H15 TaxID=3029062 RepID=A0AAU8AM81_9RHOB
MQPLEFKDVGAHLELIGPAVDPERTTVFSIFRDEMYFAPAFFDHYRSIGVTQFIIVDDGSTDGTTDYLDAQPDCIRIRSDLRYGDPIEVRDPEGKRKKTRAGIYFKGAIPLFLMPGRFVTYVDADEFLLLPPGVATIGALAEHLAAAGDVAAVAPVVEFFPRDLSAFDDPRPPANLADLLRASPCFEAEPLLKLAPGAVRPEFVAPSKSMALMARFGIEPEPEAPKGWLNRLLGRSPAPQPFGSPRHKTPIVCHSAETYMVGTHNTNRAPSATVMPVIAHFVFTAQFAAKIRRAMDWGSYANGSRKYHGYARLLAAMAEAPDAFLSPASTVYEDPRQLIDCGLMLWPETPASAAPAQNV